MGGCWDHVGMLWPLLPLRERVINAWIGSDQPDLSESDHVLEVIDLCRTPTPVRYRSRKEHHTPEGFVCFPSLALPSGFFSQADVVLRRDGLWTMPSRMKCYRPEFQQAAPKIEPPWLMAAVWLLK